MDQCHHPSFTSTASSVSILHLLLFLLLLIFLPSFNSRPPPAFSSPSHSSVSFPSSTSAVYYLFFFCASFPYSAIYPPLLYLVLFPYHFFAPPPSTSISVFLPDQFIFSYYIPFSPPIMLFKFFQLFPVSFNLLLLYPLFPTIPLLNFTLYPLLSSISFISSYSAHFSPQDYYFLLLSPASLHPLLSSHNCL